MPKMVCPDSTTVLCCVKDFEVILLKQHHYLGEIARKKAYKRPKEMRHSCVNYYKSISYNFIHFCDIHQQTPMKFRILQPRRAFCKYISATFFIYSYLLFSSCHKQNDP